MQRNGNLEEAIAQDGAEAGPWLVYADWLDERGEDTLADTCRVVGGQPDDDPEAQRWGSLFAVASAAMLHEAPTWASAELVPVGEDDAYFFEIEEDGREDDGDAAADDDEPGPFAPSQALFKAGRVLRGDIATSRLPAPDEVHGESAVADATRRYLSFLRAPEDAGVLCEAMALTRAAVPPGTLRRMLDLLAARGSTTGDPSIAEALEEGFLADDCSVGLPLPGESGAFSFRDVTLSHATRGIWGRYWRAPDERSVRAVFCALCADAQFSVRGYDALSPDERLEWLEAEHLGPIEADQPEDEPLWVPMDALEALEWCHERIVANLDDQSRRTPLAFGAGEPTPLLDALESLGPYRGGAQSPSARFPITFLAFRDAFVYSRLSY